MKFNTIVILLSILGIGILYLIATLSEPAVVELSKLSQFDGRQVIVRGMVKAYHLTNVGGQIIELHNQNTTTDDTSISIYAEVPTLVDPGDIIQVTGKVQQYKGEWEVVAAAAQDIMVLKKHGDIVFSLSQVAGNPERYVGLNITVEGQVDEASSDYFFLKDIEGKYILFVVGNSSAARNNTQDETVFVSGVFTYDAKNLRYLVRIGDT